VNKIPERQTPRTFQEWVLPNQSAAECPVP
jgi:hypothetical protein